MSSQPTDNSQHETFDKQNLPLVEIEEPIDCLKDVYDFLRPASGSLLGMGRLLAMLLDGIFKEFELTDSQKKVVLREIMMAFALEKERE